MECILPYCVCRDQSGSRWALTTTVERFSETSRAFYDRNITRSNVFQTEETLVLTLAYREMEVRNFRPGAPLGGEWVARVPIKCRVRLCGSR